MEYKIWKIQELPSMPYHHEAKAILIELSHYVQPVLSKRKWNVWELHEFYPKKNKMLLGLNVNSGQKIMVRLRDPQNEDKFLPWSSVLGTLIHELTHIVVGKHSAEFYQLMDKLSDEIEEEAVKSKKTISDTDTHFKKYQFDGPFRKLGGKKVDVKERRKIIEQEVRKRLKLDDIAAVHSDEQHNNNKFKDEFDHDSECRVSYNPNDQSITEDELNTWYCQVCVEQNPNYHESCRFCGGQNILLESLLRSLQFDKQNVLGSNSSSSAIKPIIIDLSSSPKMPLQDNENLKKTIQINSQSNIENAKIEKIVIAIDDDD